LPSAKRHELHTPHLGQPLPSFPLHAVCDEIVWMRRIVAIALMVCAPVAFATLAPACGNSCEDLDAICENCADEDYFNSCVQTVKDGNEELCGQRRALFTQECPEPQTTASSSVSGPATSGGGVGGIGGNGGTGAPGGDPGGMGGTGATGGIGGAGGAQGGTAGN
jgi:hypothetical protein